MKTFLVLLALCDVSTLSCPPTTVAASLTSDDCAAFDGSRYDEWAFSGAAGQTVTFTLGAASFDTLLMLIDPSGRPVAQNDDASATTTDSRLTFTLDATGTWTLVANSLPANGLGIYVLSADLGCPEVATGPRRRAVKP
jgi:Bacterial pre-peptidase C-terminal domain